MSCFYTIYHVIMFIVFFFCIKFKFNWTYIYFLNTIYFTMLDYSVIDLYLLDSQKMHWCNWNTVSFHYFFFTCSFWRSRYVVSDSINSLANKRRHCLCLKNSVLRIFKCFSLSVTQTRLYEIIHEYAVIHNQLKLTQIRRKNN